MDFPDVYYSTLVPLPTPTTITNSQSTPYSPCVHSQAEDMDLMAFNVCTAISHAKSPSKNKGMSHTEPPLNNNTYDPNATL